LLGRAIHKAEKAFPDPPISLVGGGLEMIEDRPMTWSSVGIVNKAINTGEVKRVDPVVGHRPNSVVDNGV
jgi:hypothetical protein